MEKSCYNDPMATHHVEDAVGEPLNNRTPSLAFNDRIHKRILCKSRT